MGWLADILNEVKDVPLSAVLKERVELAEQKYEGAIKENATLKQRVNDLENEVATLRAQIPTKQADPLGEDTTRVLVHLFRAEGHDLGHRDVGAMTRALHMDHSVLQYHLDRIREAGLGKISSGNYVTGQIFGV